MLTGLFIFIWAVTAGAMFLQSRDQKKREYKLCCRLEMLETRVDRIEQDDPAADKIRKISRMATELLSVMQEKEDDIRTLLEKVETKAVEPAPVQQRQSENIRQFNVHHERDKGSYSSSELHTIEMLKKRRQA